MSLTRIPLQQVFRNQRAKSPPSVSSRASTITISSNSSVSRIDVEEGEKKISPVVDLFAIPSKGAPVAAPRKSRTSIIITFARLSGGLGIMSNLAPTMRGTRTPQMLEYERQAEERASQLAQIEEDRAMMNEEMEKMTRETERIAQEEHEMRQYYEAEALRHAEEMRLHQEVEVRRHQARVREHERRVRDHEASSEAFAKVIVMPAKGARQISFMAPRAINGSGNGPPNGSNGSKG
ncbi:uncharacterized protein RAG0_07433 [Rhynchosporium agropyri]|uniref:Uncharacterized protein n=1 Tax=Rhynchosporium agropyri TaxID=914238 RepID=A0A1E1KLF6_9HELO|nr:uncharacterized protein RAG0_07433 [Rhynchosporium agropyri]